MVAPHDVVPDMLIGVLLIVTLGYQLILLRRGRMVTWPGIAFRARHLRWAATLWLGYGVTALAGLFAIGGIGGVAHLPAVFMPLALSLDLPPGAIDTHSIALGLGGGSLFGLVLTWWRARRGRAPWTAGDARSVMPTSNADLWPAAVLAVSAGTAEELFYRLWLPLVVALASGSGLAGVIVATGTFALMHRYQGWMGIAATFVGGGLLTALFMGTGALWVPMVVHVLIDLNALVLRPAVSAWVRRRLNSSTATRS